jgi:hypothetical protein
MGKVAIALLALGLGGCALHQQTFCSAARPIYPAKGDVLTLPTLRLIIGHDEVGERLCHWRPPAKDGK